MALLFTPRPPHFASQMTGTTMKRTCWHFFVRKDFVLWEDAQDFHRPLHGGGGVVYNGFLFCSVLGDSHKNGAKKSEKKIDKRNQQ